MIHLTSVPSTAWLHSLRCCRFKDRDPMIKRCTSLLRQVRCKYLLVNTSSITPWADTCLIDAHSNPFNYRPIYMSVNLAETPKLPCLRLQKTSFVLSGFSAVFDHSWSLCRVSARSSLTLLSFILTLLGGAFLPDYITERTQNFKHI